MKTLKIFLLCFMNLLFIWVLFILSNEFFSKSIAIDVGIISLVISIILYFVYEKKFTKILAINKVRFSITYLVFFNLINISVSFPICLLADKNILSKCTGDDWTCPLRGLEYPIFAYMVSATTALILLFMFIYLLYKDIKKQIS